MVLGHDLSHFSVPSHTWAQKMNGDKDTISDRSREVRNRIRELLTSLGEGNGSSNVRKAVEDAMHRLALWGGNLGVFRAPSSRLSLDSRLLKADAMDIHEEVMRQLDDILEAIQDCMWCLVYPEIHYWILTTGQCLISWGLERMTLV